MPDCQHCYHFDLNHPGMGPQCLLSLLPENPTTRQRKTRVKACEKAVLLKHLNGMSGDVLEVGPGVSRWIKRLIEQTGSTWYGIDPMWKDNPDKRCYAGKVGALPFPDSHFDWVVSFSSVEHWNEHRDGITEGLVEIHRVLKPGGRMLITAPYHNHGHDLFYRGMREDVQRLFYSSALWSNMVFEEWARDPSPLPALQEWRIEGWRIPKLLEATGGVEPVTSTIEIFAVK